MNKNVRISILMKDKDKCKRGSQKQNYNTMVLR